MFFEDESWAKINKSNERFCEGETIISGKKKGVKFWFSNSDCSFLLRTEGEDKRILDLLIQKLGKPNVKWKLRSWFHNYAMHMWEVKPGEAKTLYNSLCFAEVMKSGFFRFLGHKDAELLQN
jgi:hypothetical protein